MDLGADGRALARRVGPWLVRVVALGASALTGCEVIDVIARAVELMLTLAAAVAVTLYLGLTIAWVAQALRAWLRRDVGPANVAMGLSTVALLLHLLGAMAYGSTGLAVEYGSLIWGGLIFSLLAVIGCVGVRQMVDQRIGDDESD